MGLDITAYKELIPIDAFFDRYGNPIDAKTKKPIKKEYYLPTENPHYQRQDELNMDLVYSYKSAFSFRAGGYGSYNNWREELAKIAGWPLSSYEMYNKIQPSYAAPAWKADSGPFWELINFSDCEGTIGPITSAKLLKDFEKYQEKANKHVDTWFLDKYLNWKKAFKIASQNGAVDFH